ncbi:hypothetical protein D3C81_1577670 [compost metagenome]
MHGLARLRGGYVVAVVEAQLLRQVDLEQLQIQQVERRQQRFVLPGCFHRLFTQAHHLLDSGVGEFDLLDEPLGHVAGELMGLARCLSALDCLVVQQGQGLAHAFTERPVLPDEPFVCQ